MRRGSAAIACVMNVYWEFWVVPSMVSSRVAPELPLRAVQMLLSLSNFDGVNACRAMRMRAFVNFGSRVTFVYRCSSADNTPSAFVRAAAMSGPYASVTALQPPSAMSADATPTSRNEKRGRNRVTPNRVCLMEITASVK